MKPSEMSDEALTKAVAEEVMGWNFIQSEDNRYDDLWHAPASKDGWAIGIKEWDPLHRADHWMMVVERMLQLEAEVIIKPREKPIRHMVQIFYQKYWHDGFGDTVGRAVLEAALSAMRGKEGE